MQADLHLSHGDKPEKIRARSINGVNFFQLHTVRGDILTIFTATPEQATDIADGFRRAFGLNEDKT